MMRPALLLPLLLAACADPAGDPADMTSDPSADMSLNDGSAPVEPLQDAGPDGMAPDDMASDSMASDGMVSDGMVADGMAADDGGMPDAMPEPPWDGRGPFPGACRLDITGGVADRRLRWVYDEDLDITLERVDEGLDGRFEREYAFTWEDGPARVPCVESGPTPMRTPAADLALTDAWPAEGGALRGDCGPGGVRTLSETRRLANEQIRLIADGGLRTLDRRYTWGADGRLLAVDQALDDRLAPEFVPRNPHRYMDADYDGQGRVTRARIRRTVVSLLDAEDVLGFVETRRTYNGATVQVEEARDFEEGVRRRTLAYAGGRLARVTADGVVRTLGRDAAGRLISTETARGGEPTGHRGVELRLDDAGRVVEAIESMGRTAELAAPVRRARLTWNDRGNLSRVVHATRRGGQWVEGEQWTFGYGCW